MFGKKTTQTKNTAEQVKKELAVANKKIDSLTPDLVVDTPAETAGMPGFTVDDKPAVATATSVEEKGIPGFDSIGAPVAPAAEEPIAAPAPEPVKAPEPAAPVEQYQIAEIGMSPGEGLYVYKIVTNKYLGELGGVYAA